MLGDYSKVGHIFKNQFNIFAVMKAKFNLRQTKDENQETQIYLVCSINQKQEKISTGLKVRPKYWDKEKQVAVVANTLPKTIQQQNASVNKELEKLLMRFDEWQDYMLDHPEENERGAVRLREFIAGEKDKLKVNPLTWFEEAIQNDYKTSEGTKRKYLADLSTIKSFVEERNIRANSFSNLNYQFIKKFEKYMIDKGMAINTIINKMRAFLSWISSAEKQGLINPIETGIARYEMLRKKEEGKEIYLTDNEIELLRNFPLLGNEEIARDIFILQCQLGQRYDDMMHLDNAIITVDKIELIQEKTKKKVSIPLNKIAKEILLKYNNTLPFISNEYSNQLLKLIGKKAGIITEEIISIQKGNDIEVHKVKRYELISTHTARRTFVTNCLKNGILPNTIMKITGHKSMKTMNSYDKRTSEDVANELLALMEKEDEKKILKNKEKKEIASNLIPMLGIKGIVPKDVTQIVGMSFDLKQEDYKQFVLDSIDISVERGIEIKKKRKAEKEERERQKKNEKND